MGTVTYPSSEVIAFLNEHFVAYKVNTGQPTAEDRTLLASYRLLWEPGFVFLDDGGRRLRSVVGFLPPAEFLDELRLVLGKVALLHGRNTESLAWFETVGETESTVAPEALYWAGIAAYRIERDLGKLRERWSALRERYRASTWWTRADVLDGLYRP